MSAPTRIFALVTRGLESVGAEEMAALRGVTVIGCGYRRVAAMCEGSRGSLLGLRTVDDVFLDVATWRGIGRHRTALDGLRRLSGELELRPAVAVCAGLRSLPRAPAFSVSASFVGRRNYGVEEMKAAVAAGVGHRHGWCYRERDAEADLHIRVFVEQETAYVGMRLGRIPLQQRGYRREERPGALKPSVAAAMLALAGVRAGMRVLDPCCGSGTIAIEAALGGAIAAGGDRDPAALAATTVNRAATGVSVQVCQLDVRSLPFGDASVDRVVTNPPWGRAVGDPSELPELYRRLVEEARRVLVPGGRIVLLTNRPELVPQAGFRCREEREISLHGQMPAVVVLSS